MIFIAVGTHFQEFNRLIKRIDEIALELKEEIIIQRGYTKYIPKNCKSFDWKSSLDDYYKKARIIICHSAMSLIEIIEKYKKPVITVPRQYKFKEHINDHQVEFAQSAEKRLGVKAIYNIKDLTPELIESYEKKIKIDYSNLKKLQGYLMPIINEK